MPPHNRHYPSRLWSIQLAEELARRVQQFVVSWPTKLQDHPGDQLLRAADSVFSNLIEGYARHYFKDRIRFYNYAASSVEETLGWLHRCRERGYIPANDVGVLCGMYIRLGRAISNLTATQVSRTDWHQAIDE